MIRAQVALVVLLAAPYGASLADSCWAAAERSAQIDATGVTQVLISAGAGELDVRGENSRTSVDARGQACASADRFIDAIQIRSRREGDIIYINTEIPDVHEGLIGFTRYASLDLQVVVPDSVGIKVQDSSGGLRINGVRSAAIQDSSGEQHIRAIGGDVSVADSSGDISLKDIEGNVRVRDGSGQIDIERVTGNVEIVADGSGDIDIDRVSGGVHVKVDGSGSIDIDAVKGDVAIDRDGSGSIDVEDVGGNFKVGHGGSGSIHYDRIAGKVSVRDE